MAFQDATNPFDQFDAPSPAARRPGIIQGPPKEPTPPQAQTPTQAALDQERLAAAQRAAGLAEFERRKAAADAAKAEKDAGIASNPSEEASRAARAEAVEKLALARRLRASSRDDYFTGGGWQSLSGVPFVGQRQYDFESNTNTLKNAAALQRIMEMAAANGGKNPLTPLSNSDFQALANSLTSIEPGMSDEEYQRNLGVIERLYTQMYEGAGGKNLDEDIKALSAPSAGAKSAFGDAGPVGGISRLLDEKSGAAATGWKFAGKGGQIEVTYGDGTKEVRDAPAAFLNSPEAQAKYKEQFGEDLGLNVDLEGGKPQTDNERGTFFGGVDAAVRAIADVPTLSFADEIAAAGDTLFSGGTYAQNVRRQRGIDEQDSRVNPIARGAGQLVGALLPIGRAAGFGRTMAPRSALSYAGEGALLGAGYGAGSANPDPSADWQTALGQRGTGALVGGAIGAGAGALGGAVLNRVRGGGPRPPSGAEGLDVYRAAQAEGVPVSRPVVDPTKRTKMAYLESTIGGGETVRKGLEGTSEALESRVGALGGQGTAQTESAIGSQLQNAGERYIKRSGGVATRLYDRAEQMAKGAVVRGREAVQAINRNIAELSQNENANAPLIKYLKEVRADIFDENGVIPKGVDTFRNMRTALRGQISSRQLTATDAERRMGEVLAAANRDIQRDLGASSPGALRAYQRADKFYRERQGEIKAVVSKVLGNSRNSQISPERAWQNVRNMAGPKGDSAALGRLWTKLEPSEQLDAAATIAESFGRRAPDELFSPALFVSQTRALSPEARKVIFGPEGAKSIANLRVVSKALDQTMGATNRSRSGVVINWSNELRSLFTRGGIGGIAGTVVGGPVGGVAGAAIGSASNVAAQKLSARALMSPDLTKWAANAARADSPRRIEQAISGLGAVARRDPAIAQDALGLQAYLRQAMSATPSRAAASDQEQQ